MKKLLCFLVALCVIFCSSCSDNDSYIETSDSVEETDRIESKPHPSFDLFVSEFDTTLNCGDKLTVTANLKNASDENISLLHSGLVIMYIHTEKVRREDIAFTSIGIPKDFASQETETKDANFYFSEAGTYYLHAEYSFSIDGEGYYYAIEPIEITVVE